MGTPTPQAARMILEALRTATVTPAPAPAEAAQQLSAWRAAAPAAPSSPRLARLARGVVGHHEAAHTVVARAAGVPVAEIVLAGRHGEARIGIVGGVVGVRIALAGPAEDACWTGPAYLPAVLEHHGRQPGDLAAVGRLALDLPGLDLAAEVRRAVELQREPRTRFLVEGLAQLLLARADGRLDGRDALDYLDHLAGARA